MKTANSFWIRPCTLVWMALLALTALTYFFGRAGMGGTTIMLIVLSTAVIKVQMITEVFMGLHGTSFIWRLIMLVWLLLVTGLITVAYLISVN